MNITDAALVEIGKEVIRMFDLKQIEDQPNRYYTTWGSKTPMGIGACILRTVNEATTLKVEGDQDGR